MCVWVKKYTKLKLTVGKRTREREREGKREQERGRERERESKSERARQRERERHRERHTERDTERERETDRQRLNEIREGVGNTQVRLLKYPCKNFRTIVRDSSQQLI